MPDWFYRTVAQPALFCLPDKVARRLALGVIGTLGRFKAGQAVIDFLGHMEADPRLAVRVGGVDFPSPIGLGWRVDPEQRATLGLLRFGVGCVEVRSGPLRDVLRTENLSLNDGPPLTLSPKNVRAGKQPILLRQVTPNGSERIELPSGVVLPVVVWDAPATPLVTVHEVGVMLQVGTQQESGLWYIPTAVPANLIGHVRAWRAILKSGAPLLISGGVAGPEDALALVEAGADLVLVETGLIFGGPGLVKRCNEALLTRVEPLACISGKTTFHRAWFWAAALGAALALGGGLTLGLATTRVLLPYDEQYLGITSELLRRTMPRLFAFMAHDRGTLAGTMLGLGWLYLVAAWHGIRHNVHGAKASVVLSALAGFTSFFAFFGFGYFDTLHAFVAAILFQLTVQIMVGDTGPASEIEPVVDREDKVWRRAQWGQLLWIIHAAGLLIAGIVILGIGMTSVMVREDLNFLCITETELQALGSRTIGVVAHDRATLGGMLLASGVGMLLPLLWCYRRGAAWVWQAVAGLGLPAYAIAIGVHLWVGYKDWRHLVPALVGLLLWLAGLYLSRGYLARRGMKKESGARSQEV